MILFRGVIEQSCAKTLVTAVALQDVKVNAALASAPEGGVGSELVKCHRAVSEVMVHLHDCGSGSKREYLCLRKHFSRQPEYALFYTGGEAYAAKLVSNDKSRVCHKLFVTPAFDIAEPGKFAITCCFERQ